MDGDDDCEECAIWGAVQCSVHADVALDLLREASEDYDWAQWAVRTLALPLPEARRRVAQLVRSALRDRPEIDVVETRYRLHQAAGLIDPPRRA